MATQQQRSQAIDNLFTSTWFEVRKELVDQVFKIVPFYNLMAEKGNMKAKSPDGTHWEVPIQYAKLNQNTKWFGRGTTFGREEKEFMTTLLYAVKYLGTSITRYWVDDQKNKGKAKILDYVKTKLDNTKAALQDSLETDMFVQNASALAMTAMPTLISTTPMSGTVGGLDRSANAWMSNQVTDFTGLTAGVDLLPKMTNIYNTCSKFKSGSRKAPDIIITTQEIYEAFEAIAVGMQHIVTSTTSRASLGFGTMAFKGTEVFWAPECPTGRMYFINSENLQFMYDPTAWMEMTEWKSMSGNSLDKECQILSACQMTVDNFQKHGVIHNITLA